MAGKEPINSLVEFSVELAEVVERASASLVRVDDGSRLTATGIIWSADGLIATTSHGVERDEELLVELADGSRHAAAVVGRDSDTDVAFLKIQATGLPTMETAEFDAVKVGNLVLALGRPGSAGLHATLGIISTRRESQTNGQPGYVLNTDADFYPGFSGGALVSVGGQLVGMTNRMFRRGAGITLSPSIVNSVYESLHNQNHAKRGYLGVRTQLVILPEAMVTALNLTQDRGLLVVQAEPGSPADQAGLLLGDTLLRINDQAIQDVDVLRRHLIADQTIPLQILRGGELRDITVTLTAEQE